MRYSFVFVGLVLLCGLALADEPILHVAAEACPAVVTSPSGWVVPPSPVYCQVTDSQDPITQGTRPDSGDTLAKLALTIFDLNLFVIFVH